jgi:predicted alpha/beta-fold hydrolase
MWESLATTRRQDRVLHGFAKMANMAAGFFLMPLWLLGQRLSTPVRRLMGRVHADTGPLPIPPIRERSMDALMADLEAIPHELRKSNTAELRKGLSDWAPFVLAQHRHSTTFGYSYPSQFRHVNFHGADGVPIAATLALHERERPGLIVVHGLFSTNMFDYVREIAVRAYYDWGFNVAAVDLRSFGLTDMMSDAPSTGGWKEGEDIVEAGRWLLGLGSTSVGALGISLGGSSVLNAASVEGAEDALAGGILAICAPSDTHMAAERLSRQVSWRHPAYPMSKFFQALLVAKVRNGRWPDHIRGLVEPIDAISAPYYGVTAEEIWERSSAKNSIGEARVPVLALHAADDQVIPVEHAHMLAQAAAGNELVRSWVVPAGQHAAFDAIDERWTYGVYRGFFERWAQYAERDVRPVSGENGRDAPAGDKLVYLPASSGKAESASGG